MGVTSDGASINRRLIRLHGPKIKLLHKTPNPFANDGRHLLFFSDPPHLIKQTGTVGHLSIETFGYTIFIQHMHVTCI